MDEPVVNQTPGAPARPALVSQPKPKKVYEIDLRDRVLLVLALGLGTLLADLLLAAWKGFPGLGVTLLALAWEGVMLWYAGREKPVWKLLGKKENLLLTLAVLLLASVFALSSNHWFYFFNLLALPVLMTVQMFELFGVVQYPWVRPAMLPERAYLLLEGLCWKAAAAIPAAKGRKGGPGKRVWYVLAGLAVGAALLLLVLPLLVTADVLFDRLTGEAVRFLSEHFAVLAGRLIVGFLLAPFLFGLLYSLRRPEGAELGLDKVKLPAADPALAATALAVMDALYLFFVAVQFRGLFGGKTYLEAAGISFADYARSDFFQLVWVSAINLAVVLLAVQFTCRQGKLWRGVQVLCSLMVGLSGLLLISAAGRMTLYVAEYGLSLKRFLTYWGMVMLAVFFAAVLLKTWKKNFAFFKVLFAAGVAGWLVLNFCGVDRIVAGYNVTNYLSGNLPTVDEEYLALSSYESLSYLDRLPGDTQVLPGYPNPTVDDGGQGDASYPSCALRDMLADRRAAAAADASSWRTWTLSAYLAAKS
ncbi:MAG: DUF4173 domain-containing protein [Clostridia bacterium]|nr:DUF4173 domain-containing protein [Clostridia bacterium]